MVVGSHLPVTLEKAIYLSALQLHIETVLHDSGEALSPVATNGSSSLARSSRKTLKSRQTLRTLYTKAKNVTRHGRVFQNIMLTYSRKWTCFRAVPYIGVFLKDLTFICDGNPDYLRGGLINVHKRRQVYSKVEEIKRLQKNGPAVIDGNLKQGDVLLSINGTPLEGLSVSEATTVFRNSTNLAKLIVSPNANRTNRGDFGEWFQYLIILKGFDPGVIVGIVVGAAAGVLLLVLVVIAIGCYVWKKHTLRTYRIQNVAAGVEDSMALEYKKEAAAENEYQLDVERQSYTVYTTV
eukprot:Em0006g1105a